MRLGDLDALKKDFEERNKACDKWIEKAKDEETKIRASAVKSFICEVIMTIDNAPTVPLPDFKEGYKQAIIDGKTNFSRPQGEFTEEDMKRTIKENFDIGYEMAKNKYKRPQGEWIPVSERLPDDLEPVNITWINHEPEPYYKEIKDKPFTATGVYFNGQWYWWSTLCTDTLAEYSHNFDDIIDNAIEIVAWQPLPKPYKEGGAE